MKRNKSSSDPTLRLLSITGAESILSTELIQELWSGYGEISRITLQGAEPVVVKCIRWPDEVRHPRGWATDISHARKVKSYEVELNFYQDFADVCGQDCRVPRYLGAQHSESEILLVLEDLNACGFPKRLESVGRQEIEACLSWLANFHACFMGVVPDGLWEKGCYWHLDTRPDELEALSDVELKKSAPLFDSALIEGVPQTLVHGDAKLANFCFSEDGRSVAAVDFQYVGGGCGMKDLAYFMGSCLYDDECEAQESWMLDYYFSKLKKALISKNKTVDFPALESVWRSVFPVAWADFHRFLKGWSPGHWKINSYSEKMCRIAIAAVKK